MEAVRCFLEFLLMIDLATQVPQRLLRLLLIHAMHKGRHFAAMDDVFGSRLLIAGEKSAEGKSGSVLSDRLVTLFERRENLRVLFSRQVVSEEEYRCDRYEGRWKRP